MKKILYRTMIAGFAFLLFSGSVMSQELTAQQVLDRVEHAIEANSAEIHMRMKLYSAAGSERERSLAAYAKETDELSKSFIRFTQPADIEGTSFLSLAQEGGDEEMYLFLPVVGSVRKIAGSQKSGSFVGTDFTYNDLTILGGGNYGEDYEASILEQSAGEYILRLEPLKEEINYQYARMWVPASNWFPTKIEFYDANEQLSKVLTNREIEQIDGNWTAREITMENVQKGTRTVLRLTEVRYNVSLDDQIFTTRYMMRQR